jgi:hypothetical protein
VIEILDNLRVLEKPALELAELSLDHVAFGARGHAIPRDRIVEVSGSPLVASSTASTGTLTTYFDAAGAEIPLDRVLDSVIDAQGMVHFANKISFKLAGGVVVGFALYGPQLDVFGKLETPDAVVAIFGSPDRRRENVSYGDLMGHDFYYAGSQKQVSWDAWNLRVSLVNLGDYPLDY